MANRWIQGLILALAMMGTQALADVAGDVRQTITQQIDAFQKNDVNTAFEYASPGIQSMFRSAENFGAMVQNGYPMVWRPKDVRFGALSQRGDAWLQTVLIRDAAGVIHALEYRMEQLDGAWRIAGVRFFAVPELAA